MMKICTVPSEVSQTHIWLNRQEGKCFGSEMSIIKRRLSIVSLVVCQVRFCESKPAVKPQAKYRLLRFARNGTYEFNFDRVLVLLISQKDYVTFYKLPKWIIGLGGNMMKICTVPSEVSQTHIWLNRQ